MKIQTDRRLRKRGKRLVLNIFLFFYVEIDSFGHPVTCFKYCKGEDLFLVHLNNILKWEAMESVR